jgi:hypothetical protein
MTTGEGVEGLDTVLVLVVDMALSFLSVGDRLLCLLLAPLYLDFSERSSDICWRVEANIISIRYTQRGLVDHLRTVEERLVHKNGISQLR